MVIYLITNHVNNKIYIGKTEHKNPEKYYEYHLNRALLDDKNRDFYNKPLYRAIRKYGKNSFSFQIIDMADTRSELNEKEIFYIDKYNSFSGDGYNITKGGDGGDTMSKHPNKKDIYKRSADTFKRRKRGWKYLEYPDKTKQQISKSLCKYRKNNPMTEEQKNKISESLRGRVFSDDTIEKLRIANIGENNPMYGKRSWNSGQTTKTNEKILQYGIKSSKTKLENYKTGKTVIWNKGMKLGKQSETLISKRTKCKWRIVHPNGNEEIVLVLKNWCVENDIPYNKIWRHKNHEGFVIEKIYE